MDLLIAQLVADAPCVLAICVALRRRAGLHYEWPSIVVPAVLLVVVPGLPLVFGAGALIYLWHTRRRIEPRWQHWSALEPGSPEFVELQRRVADGAG